MERKSERSDGLWDALVQAANLNERQGVQTCGIICGHGASGKTSLINSFLSSSKEDKVKPSVALEYYFARRTNATNNAKDTAHMWELAGGDGASIDLLDVPLDGKDQGIKLRRMNVILVLDLSQPQDCIRSAQHWLTLLRSRIRTQLEQAPAVVHEALEARMAYHVPRDHEDRRIIDVFPLPLLIVGNKYDCFREFEPAPRKALALALRYLAHMNGASLVFTSVKDRALKENFRAICGALLFRVSLRKGLETSPDKALLISAGADSMDKMEADLPQDLRAVDMSSPSRAVAFWEQTLEDFFGAPSRSEEKDGGELRDDQNEYKEAAVDEARAQKDAELLKYRRDVERRERLRKAQGKTSSSTKPSRKRSSKS